MEADDRTRNDLSSALMGLLAALSRGALQRPVERTRVGLTSRHGPGRLDVHAHELSCDRRRFDRSRIVMFFEGRDRAIGKYNLVVLTLPYQLHVDEEDLAGLGIVVDFASALEVIQCDLNRIFQQGRQLIFEASGHDLSLSPSRLSFNAGKTSKFLACTESIAAEIRNLDRIYRSGAWMIASRAEISADDTNGFSNRNMSLNWSGICESP